MQKTTQIITMEIKDNGGDPVIPPGAKVYCTEDIPVSDGDYILVKRKGDAPLVRLYTIRSDGSILLKSMNRNADSYVTTTSGLTNTGYYVVLRSEFNHSAAKKMRNGVLEYFIAQEKSEAAPVPAPSPEAVCEEEDEFSAGTSELLTFDEALAALKVKRTKMYALLRSGALQAVKIGKLWRIERSAIKAYLQSIKSST
jgi:excisionase family DNA binding protein